VTFAAFRVRSFRFQWPADLLTSWAFEMESVILGWYVMVNTGSVVLLTVFGSLQFLGTLAAPMFGVLGDRLSGRLMLCAMRATYMGLAALLMFPALVGHLTPTWVFIVAALSGIVRPNDLVMRTSLIGETIPPPHLMGALGLSRATGDSARVAGALIGAGLSSVLGIGWTYVFVTAFYAAGLALTFGVSRQVPVPIPGAASIGEPGPGRSGRTVSLGAPRPSPWHHLKEGLVLILGTPSLLAMMWLAFLINLTAYPVSSGLLPYVARQIYHVDAAGLGWLVASFGLGGLLASLGMAATGGSRHPERATLVCTAIWYALLLGFGHLRSASAGFVTLLVAGFFQNVAMISMSAVILAAAGDGFRARVMGVRTLAVYGLPLGLLGSGILIGRVGYPLTITATATMSLVVTLLIGIRWRASMWHSGRQRAGARSIPQRA